MRSILFSGCMLLCFFTYSQDKDVASLLLPQPVSLKQGNGNFILNNKTTIQVLSEDPSARRVANFLSEKLSGATGFSIIANTSLYSAKNSIKLSLLHEASLG